MSKNGLQTESNGTGDSAQVFPLIPGNIGSTSAADSIDVSGYRYIYFGTDCTIYLDQYTTKTLSIVAGEVFGCLNCSTIHVDSAVEYALA